MGEEEGVLGLEMTRLASPESWLDVEHRAAEAGDALGRHDEHDLALELDRVVVRLRQNGARTTSRRCKRRRAMPFTSSHSARLLAPGLEARAARTSSKAAGVTAITSSTPKRYLGPMPAEPSAPADAHEWVSFEDPTEERTWLMDVTFLASPWRCIYGAGCQGVLTAPAPEQMEGCCSYGAHFTDEADASRVGGGGGEPHRRAMAVPPKGTGQGRARTRDAKGAITTRLVAGACIFLNRPSHPGGIGCALHKAALERGVPASRAQARRLLAAAAAREDSVAPDGHVTSSLGEWARRHWGEGGKEFAWWCTEAPEAFTAREPVYVSLRDELSPWQERRSTTCSPAI